MIGIFDSGMGGLTVLKAIREEMPSIDVLYFGDTLNVPYGTKSREEISKLTVNAIQILRARGARSIVSACNTVAASMTLSLFDTFSLLSSPVAPGMSDLLIEMVGPTVSYFKNSSARLLLCATPATIDSGMYQNAFQMIGKEVEVFSIPELAGAIESGLSETESDTVIEHIIRKSLEHISLENFDVLILACTHYPLVSNVFERIVGSSVHVFDPALAVAERVKRQLWPREMADGKITFLISKDSEPFRSHAAKLFGNVGDAPGALSMYTIEVIG